VALELPLLITELSREEPVLKEPGDKDAVALPEVEAQQLAVGDPASCE